MSRGEYPFYCNISEISFDKFFDAEQWRYNKCTNRTFISNKLKAIFIGREIDSDPRFARVDYLILHKAITIGDKFSFKQKLT